ncbi:unnamed protein product [Protopolystoma xenopodis]|uniref:Uncharacterized protein n=1 Tax=Protopolystoma xenopodis TaxID=117903 RepID=A0A3S4ZGY2_9PLAT|nr:unnamed protein product [Protopolystoma xenopodis]
MSSDSTHFCSLDNVVNGNSDICAVDLSNPEAKYAKSHISSSISSSVTSPFTSPDSIKLLSETLVNPITQNNNDSHPDKNFNSDCYCPFPVTPTTEIKVSHLNNNDTHKSSCDNDGTALLALPLISPAKNKSTPLTGNAISLPINTSMLRTVNGTKLKKSKKSTPANHSKSPSNVIKKSNFRGTSEEENEVDPNFKPPEIDVSSEKYSVFTFIMH